MSVLVELERFITGHRACSRLEGDAEPVTETGYHMWVACSCGERFERWIGEADAEEDLGIPN
jgi:hypothetical protein